MRLTLLITRPLGLAAALLLTAALLGACGREDVNARQQSGVWAIRRVTAITYDTVGTVLTTATATDAGEVAFINIAGQAGSINDEARFYLDRPVPSRQLAALTGSGAGEAVGTIVTEWIPDDHERRRIILRPVTDDPLLALTAFSFTIADETADTQRWQYVVGDAASDRILYRETWEMAREK